MYILIAYDVQTSSSDGERRLRRVARLCTNYGQRVQNSVFECLVTSAQFVILKHELASVIDHSSDSIRIYKLSKNYRTDIETLGKVTSFDIEGELLI